MMTHYYLEFMLIGDDFSIDKITNALQIQPSKTHKKGEATKYGNKVYDTCCWLYQTPVEEGYDTDSIFEIVLQSLGNKVDLLNKLKRDLNLMAKLCCVIIMENGDAPAMGITPDFGKFLYSIGATLDFDMYIN